jgi:hypothetical protein
MSAARTDGELRASGGPEDSMAGGAADVATGDDEDALAVAATFSA